METVLNNKVNACIEAIADTIEYLVALMVKRAMAQVAEKISGN